MNNTPIYDAAFEAACDHAIETGQEGLLDALERMDAETRPESPIIRSASWLS